MVKEHNNLCIDEVLLIHKRRIKTLKAKIIRSGVRGRMTDDVQELLKQIEIVNELEHINVILSYSHQTTNYIPQFGKTL